MIELVNDKTWIVKVQDLGIELQPNESMNLENISERDLLDSEDLTTQTGTLKIDSVITDYDTVIKYIKKLNHYEHLQVKTHAHNIRGTSFFDTEKVDGMTSKITYYTDGTKTNKVREEEIIRDINGGVYKIESKVYNNNVVEEKEIQTFDRVDGKVDSIYTTLE